MVDWMRQALTRRVGLKIFAGLLSVAVFVVMRGGDMRSRSMYVRLEATIPGPEADKQLVSELPDRIQVVVTGRWPLIDSAQPRDPVRVDLSHMQPFHYIDPRTLGLPAGIKAQITPSSLALQWEERVEKDLPVRAELRGGAPAGTELVGAVRVMPPTLKLKGPRGRLEQLQEVIGVPIDPSGLKPGRHRVKLDLSPLPTYVDMAAPVRVEASFELAGTVRELRVSRVPIQVLGVGPGAGQPALKPARVDLVLSGSAEGLKQFDPQHLVPVVDVGKIAPGSFPLPVPVQVRGVPVGLELSKVLPVDVLVVPVRRASSNGR